MIEIEKISFNYNNNILNMRLVSLLKEDTEMVRRFILEQYEMLERKDFFIIEDIDTELPLLFGQNTGFVYGIVMNDSLIAIQAIDCSVKNDAMLRNHLRNLIDDKIKIYEMGWTMVDYKLRGHHIAEYLLEYIQSKINDENIALIATVHPENILALKLYFKNGFKGYVVDNYYGYCRFFLIKTLKYSNLYFDNGVYVDFADTRMIKEMLERKYICTEIIKRKNKFFYLLQLQPVNENGSIVRI